MCGAKGTFVLNIADSLICGFCTLLYVIAGVRRQGPAVSNGSTEEVPPTEGD
jgi:hypothetical protein